MAGPGSSLEERVLRVLHKLGWEDDDMSLQYPLNGGRSHLGGIVVDFVIWALGPLAIVVNGEYWHKNAEVEFLETEIVLDAFRREPVIVWGEEIQTDEMALAVLTSRVGRAV